MQAHDVDEPKFWENIYKSQSSPGWDVGQPAPPFVALLTGDSLPPPGKIAVLGCGKGHEVALFADHGFDVVGVDFAPSAIRDARGRLQRENLKAELLQQDIFSLPNEHQSHFDYVLEHTCFCAINPVRRSEYVQLVQTILKPTGTFISLFFARPPRSGPPFGTTKKEIRLLFEPAFEISTLHVATNSIERRQGRELFAIMKLREDTKIE